MMEIIDILIVFGLILAGLGISAVKTELLYQYEMRKMSTWAFRRRNISESLLRRRKRKKS